MLKHIQEMPCLELSANSHYQNQEILVKELDGICGLSRHAVSKARAEGGEVDVKLKGSSGLCKHAKTLT